MKFLDLKQGTGEWLAHRAACLNASDAPAMMGLSPYRTRADLLREKATGIVPEYDQGTLARFRAGHEAEDTIRPEVEQIIGEELYPVVGENVIDGLRLSASSDGLTMDGLTGFEHKLWNEALARAVQAGALPETHFWQIVHQHAVFGLERTMFVVSDGTPEHLAWCWVTVTDEQIRTLLAAWKQFQVDVANWQPDSTASVAVPNEPGTLPAVFVRVEGRVVSGDMRAHREAVTRWVSALPSKFETDQDFADGIAAVKACEKAEGDLKALSIQVRGQMASVDEVFRLIEEATKEIAGARLRIDKAVKAEKDRKRMEEVARGREVLAAHWAGLNTRVGGLMPGAPIGGWGEAIKGLKTIASIRDAIDAELARAKIEANEIADRIDANIRAMGDHRHLFPDLAQVATKSVEDFANLLAARKAEAERRESERVERERILAEEQANAEREARAAVESAQQDQRATETGQTAMDTPQAPAASTPPTLKLGDICHRLGFIMSADFIAKLGIEPSAREKAAKLYHEADFQRICIALVRHIGEARRAALTARSEGVTLDAPANTEPASDRSG